MIVDTHCHAWRQWPYNRNVPDAYTRGSVESLLYEMDEHGVDHAAVVCARIGGGRSGAGFANTDNNGYVTQAALRYPDRLTAWIDVDSVWSPEHHTSGAATRLRSALEDTGARGFTHYVPADNDGWFRSEEAAAFFDVAEQAGVVASLAVSPAWFEDLAGIVAAWPRLPVLLHHMGLPGHGEASGTGLAALLRLAEHTSVGVKVSGFNYNSRMYWDYPYPDSIALFRQLVETFGAERLYWGSDFPASRHMLTYRQSLEVVRTHCAFIGEDALARILGANAAVLLEL